MTIVTANFSQHVTENIHLTVPNGLIRTLTIADDSYLLDEHIEGIQRQNFTVEKGLGTFNIELKPLASLVWVLSLDE